jgi:hypothetical protein
MVVDVVSGNWSLILMLLLLLLFFKLTLAGSTALYIQPRGCT